jgi:hypothetical protein
MPFQLPVPAIAQSVASPSATPTLAARLDHPAADFDRNRIDLHVTYPDYREVGGMRVPHRCVESTEIGGRMIYQVERVELAPDPFTLQPSTDSGRGT